MLNHIALMGRLTAAPDVRTTSSNISCCRITLAVERDYKDKQSGEKATDFIDVVGWRSTADFMGHYFQKGQLVAVSGRLETRTYTDRDGNKRKAFEVNAENVYFAESKRQNDTGSSYSAITGMSQESFSQGSSENFTQIPDDDLPF